MGAKRRIQNKGPKITFLRPGGFFGEARLFLNI